MACSSFQGLDLKLEHCSTGTTQVGDAVYQGKQWNRLYGVFNVPPVILKLMMKTLRQRGFLTLSVVSLEA